MPCKPCEERWRIVLAQQSKIENMKDSKKKEAAEEVVTTQTEVQAAPVVTAKLDFNKLVEDRRKVLLDGKTINK